jgi:hypothetical protein
MSHLEYVEREAAKNMEFHLQNMECLQKESNTTLTLLYVLVTASFSAALKLFETAKETSVAFALSGLCVYLTILAVCLVLACLSPRTVKAPTNEPENLKLREGYTSDEIRQFELDNLQQRIHYNRERNEVTARRLKLVRVMLCLSPLLFAALFLVFENASGHSWF